MIIGIKGHLLLERITESLACRGLLYKGAHAAEDHSEDHWEPSEGHWHKGVCETPSKTTHCSGLCFSKNTRNIICGSYNYSVILLDNGLAECIIIYTIQKNTKSGG